MDVDEVDRLMTDAVHLQFAIIDIQITETGIGKEMFPTIDQILEIVIEKEILVVLLLLHHQQEMLQEAMILVI